MRMTEQRRVIARVLAEAVDHPDVEELYRRCVAVDDKISISTVYRTVKLFEDAGIIERHDFREGRARYEQMRDSHHDHLINLRDGKVIEFTSEEIEKLQAEIARKLGYKLVDHRLELYCVPLDDDKSLDSGSGSRTRNLEIPGSMLAHRPGMTAQALDFRSLSLYLSLAPHWRRFTPAFRFHEAAAQAAYQVLWLPDERLRCAAHGGHAGGRRLCRDRRASTTPIS